MPAVGGDLRDDQLWPWYDCRLSDVQLLLTGANGLRLADQRARKVLHVQLCGPKEDCDRLLIHGGSP